MVRIIGGDKIKQFLSDLVYNFKANPKVEVGFFDGSGYEDGTTFAEVAQIQEYGTDTIPARPFMRITTQQNSDKWTEHLAKGIKWYRFRARQAVDEVGSMMAEDMKNIIRSNIPPPNSPETLRKKRGTQTLIDTGDLLNNVQYKVTEQA